MNITRVLRTLLALTSMLLVLSPSGSSTASSRPVVVVIVAPGEPIKNVSRAELRRLFSRQSESIDGRRMVPFNQPPRSDARVQFDRLALGMSEGDETRRTSAAA